MADDSRWRPRNWRVTELLKGKLSQAEGSRRWGQALIPAGQAVLEALGGTQEDQAPPAPDYTPFIIGAVALGAVLLLANKK